jgi:hypothetical protein
MAADASCWCTPIHHSGLAAMLSGALIAATAITRTCPLSELLGIDTSKGYFHVRVRF